MDGAHGIQLLPGVSEDRLEFETETILVRALDERPVEKIGQDMNEHIDNHVEGIGLEPFSLAEEEELFPFCFVDIPDKKSHPEIAVIPVHLQTREDVAHMHPETVHIEKEHDMLRFARSQKGQVDHGIGDLVVTMHIDPFLMMVEKPFVIMRIVDGLVETFPGAPTE